MSIELDLLLAEAAKIPDDDIEEPNQPIAVRHLPTSKKDDLETKKIFTLQKRKTRELDNLKKIASRSKHRQAVPNQVRYREMELQQEILLLRNILSYSISRLKLLCTEATAIPDGDTEEPDLPVASHHTIVGIISDSAARKIFTLYNRRVRRLDYLHNQVNGPMKVKRTIPNQVINLILDLQEDMDLLRIIFFYSVSKKFRLFDRRFIHAHEGWLVSWSRQHTPIQQLPSLGSPPSDNDDDDTS